MIVYACTDLLFASKVSSAANAAQAVSRPARSVDMLRARLEQIDDGKANQSVAAVFIELTRDDATDLIDLAVQHPSQPTVVAFGPHVEVQALEDAKQRGAHEVLARGTFAQQLPQLIQRFNPAS